MTASKTKTQSRRTSWRGYRPGHPWYYVLGGMIRMPKEILAEVRQSGYQGYMAERINKADRLAEPKRSFTLREIRASVRADLWRDLSRYREVVKNLRLYRLKHSKTQDRKECEGVHVCVSLKHNHLYNDFAILVFLDDLLAKQPDLFD